MARAGMSALRRGNHGNSECDDVQRSIELLDRVLSEFDDVENANQVQNIQQISGTPSTPQQQQQSTIAAKGASITPGDESPSLGHQSEDDGYMSMNGRKAKFSLEFKPLTEVPMYQEEANNAQHMHLPDPNDFPPPPEEAQRIISNLLPKVSPAHSAKRTSITRIETIPPPQRFQNNAPEVPASNGLLQDQQRGTQTHLPKTHRPRPFGCEANECHPLPPAGCRYGSLPRVPPRTVPSALDRHREVRRRRGSEEVSSSDVEDTVIRPLSELADDEHFSDDSLEEMLLPPPPPPPPSASASSKRASVAWEVSLDDVDDDEDDTYGVPGRAKVIGRRRRPHLKSGSLSSTSSHRMTEFDEWPEPPPCTTEDEVTSPYSDDEDDEEVTIPHSLSAASLSGTSTYVIRRGRKDRKSLPQLAAGSVNSSSSLNSRLSSDLSIPHSRFSGDLHARLSRELQQSPKSRRSLDLSGTSQELSSPSSPSCRMHSNTFDNIKSLIQEGVIEHYNGPHIETTTELCAMVTPIVRVVSLPSLSAEESSSRRELAVTVEEEEEEEGDSNTSGEISPLRKIEKNISELLERRDIQVSSLMLQMNGVEKTTTKKKSTDLQKSSSHSEILRSEDYYRQLLIDGGNVNQYRRPAGIQKSESAKEMLISHRERDARVAAASFVDVLDFPPLPPSPVQEDDEYSEIMHQNKADTLPPEDPPLHKEPSSNSLKTRSMDGAYGRGRRNYSGNRERRTLPSEMESKRKCYQRRTSHSPQEEHLHLMQTSCSLPETPIFARGCDIPRTPHRRAPDVPNQTAPRQSSTMGNINTIGNMSTGGFRRGVSNASGLEQAYMGTELLRMAGGPARGWYPKQRQRRPASIEHLDRLAPGQNAWDAASRKPLTLPPNLTPKFFHKSPRDALRRVTSLLIRKGASNGKESKKEKDKEMTSPTIHERVNAPEETHKKKGFFKSLWKRSRHYSLEQQ